MDAFKDHFRCFDNGFFRFFVVEDIKWCFRLANALIEYSAANRTLWIVTLIIAENMDCEHGHEPEGNPYKEAISQKLAKDLWAKGELIGASRHAEVRVAEDVEINGEKTTVVVKRWLSTYEQRVQLCNEHLIKLEELRREGGGDDKAGIEAQIARYEDERKSAQEKANGPGAWEEWREAREKAKFEVEKHLEVWRSLEQECRQYLSVPACMSFDTDAREGTFTVQSYIGGETGTVCQTASSLSKEPWMRLLSPLMRHELVRKYAKMLACVHRAGILHNDLHGGNVLVVHNFSASGVGRHFEWRVIDWGFAKNIHKDLSYELKPFQEWACIGPPNDERGKLWTRDMKWRWHPGLPVRSTGGEVLCLTEKQHMLAILYNMLVDYDPSHVEKNDRLKKIEARVAYLKDSPVRAQMLGELRRIEEEMKRSEKHKGPVTEQVVSYWLATAYAESMGRRLIHGHEQELSQLAQAADRSQARYGAWRHRRRAAREIGIMHSP